MIDDDVCKIRLARIRETQKEVVAETAINQISDPPICDFNEHKGL